ncbi:MAG: CDP-diacylglycerol--serine O-phosphatidyltransferase [Euryarchaeota archaeon]|nr:CDP-diacylglycerol--serine O-phosphatidyltransferase [Euryarchaeota archaeon]
MNMKDYIALPDILSVSNAIFGFLSIIMVTTGDLVLAAKFMLISVIFDSLDGWVARRTKRVDEFGFGKNIDSLSDVISFGLAPAIFLYSACISYDIRYINILVSLLIVICGILRLARFNVIADLHPYKKEFVGLPIPSTAVILASFYLSGMFRMDISLVIMTVLSMFMISTIRYPKIKGTKKLAAGGILVIATCLPQSIQSSISNVPAKLLFIVMLLYLLIVPLMGVYTKIHRSGPNVR